MIFLSSKFFLVVLTTWNLKSSSGSSKLDVLASSIFVSRCSKNSEQSCWRFVLNSLWFFPAQSLNRSGEILVHPSASVGKSWAGTATRELKSFALFFFYLKRVKILNIINVCSKEKMS